MAGKTAQNTKPASTTSAPVVVVEPSTPLAEPATLTPATPLSPWRIARSVPRTPDLVRLEREVAELRATRADVQEIILDRIAGNRRGDDDKTVNALVRDREDIERQIAERRAELQPHADQHKTRVWAALHPTACEAAREMLAGIEQFRSGCTRLEEIQRASGDLPIHLQSTVNTVTPFLTALEAIARGVVNAWVPE